MGYAVLLAAVFIASAFPDSNGQQQTACSPESRARNLDQCLSAIRFRALDTVSSPYGPSYFNRCPPEERFNINCFETPRLDEPQSLAQLTFRVDDPDLSMIDRFMTIQYTSPPGSYSGCDHIYNYPNTKSIFVNPLVDMAYPSWDLRQHPTIQWDYSESEFFTLIIVDPNWTTKEVISNIRGNDYQNAWTLSAYAGLNNWQNSPRSFAFILYRQTQHVFLERIPSFGFNVTDFAERNQLQGPVALSWVNVQYDAYAVATYPWGENCASLVQDTLSVRLPGIAFLPGPDEVNLSVFLRVRYQTTPATYNCGDYFVTRPAEDFYLDSVEPNTNILDTADLRVDTFRTFTFTMNKIMPRPSDFDGKLHTNMLIASGGMFHGMLVNIEGNNFTVRGLQPSSGNFLSGYEGPNPTEEEGTQQLMFMLLEQETRLPATTDPRPYLSSTGEFTNLGSFLSDHRMRLVGVSRMFVEFDEYSRCNQSTDGNTAEATAECLN